MTLTVRQWILIGDAGLAVFAMILWLTGLRAIPILLTLPMLILAGLAWSWPHDPARDRPQAPPRGASIAEDLAAARAQPGDPMAGAVVTAEDTQAWAERFLSALAQQGLSVPSEYALPIARAAYIAGQIPVTGAR